MNNQEIYYLSNDFINRMKSYGFKESAYGNSNQIWTNIGDIRLSYFCWHNTPNNKSNISCHISSNRNEIILKYKATEQWCENFYHLIKNCHPNNKESNDPRNPKIVKVADRANTSWIDVDDDMNLELVLTYDNQLFLYQNCSDAASDWCDIIHIHDFKNEKYKEIWAFYSKFTELFEESNK